MMVDFHIRGTKENASVLDPMFHVLEEEDRLRQTREQSICDVRSVQGSAKRLVPRLRECCRQGQAEVVSNSRNRIYQTWK